MSAIFGIYNIAGLPITRERLSSMSDSLVHRGPDDSGQWLHENVGLGHRMLRTTPESKGEQLPYFHRETEIAITADCRLDNRDELISRLGSDNFRSDVIPDSLIIIQAYLRWQENCVAYLLGDFSFVLWDRRNQKLFCGRDHLGIKPFYYYFEGGEFIFCSESLPIAQKSGIRALINKSRIGDHLTPHMEGFDKTSTFFTNIHRLPPAHTITIVNGHIKTENYWLPGAGDTLRLSDDQEYIQAFSELLTRAVADRCRGVESPGILLSGGIDSASIMGVVRELRRKESDNSIHTYSGILEEVENCKESQMIKILTGTEKITPLLYTPEDFTNEIDDVFSLVSKLQEPFDIGMVLVFALYRKAAANGTKVMLDGVDGDVLTSLSPSYPAHLFRKGSFISGVKETIRQSRGLFKNYYSVPTLLFHYLRSALAPEWIKEWRSKWKDNDNINNIISRSAISDSFAEQIQFKDRLKLFEETHRKKNLSFPNDHYTKGVLHPFLTVGIERYDRVGSLCSIEPRHPLADRRIVEFFSTLPWNQMVRNGWTKYLLRKVAEQHLPSEICWRTGKEHTGWNFSEALLNRKQKNINRMISKHCAQLGMLTNYNIEIKAGCAYNVDKVITNQSHVLDIGGLAMWLENL